MQSKILLPQSEQVSTLTITVESCLLNRARDELFAARLSAAWGPGRPAALSTLYTVRVLSTGPLKRRIATWISTEHSMQPRPRYAMVESCTSAFFNGLDVAYAVTVRYHISSSFILAVFGFRYLQRYNENSCLQPRAQPTA